MKENHFHIEKESTRSGECEDTLSRRSTVFLFSMIIFLFSFVMIASIISMFISVPQIFGFVPCHESPEPFTPSTNSFIGNISTLSTDNHLFNIVAFLESVKPSIRSLKECTVSSRLSEQLCASTISTLLG